jgi:RNA polymerase-binding transcription factor DksA
MKNENYQTYLKALEQFLESCNCRLRPVEESPIPADWEDRAAANHDRYVENLDEEIRWQTCEAARRALRRIEDGEFGTCAECGQSIGAARLAALPWTDCCLECQARREAAEAMAKAA